MTTMFYFGTMCFPVANVKVDHGPRRFCVYHFGLGRFLGQSFPTDTRPTWLWVEDVKAAMRLSETEAGRLCRQVTSDAPTHRVEVLGVA